MAKIINYLDNIKNAMFGKDVRSSIHDGIAAINEEVESTTARQKVLDSTFEQLTINAGSSNAEIVAGRTNAEGKSFDTIGKRLNSVDSQIKEKANDNEVVKKGYGTLNDFDETTRATIQGIESGTINAVLGYKNVTPINTSFFKHGVNMFNKNTTTDNAYIVDSTGEIETRNATNFFASNYIDVEGLTIIKSNQLIWHHAFLDASQKYISGSSVQTQEITIPQGAKWLRVSTYGLNLKDSLMLYDGNKIQNYYVPYEEFIPYKYTEVKPFDVNDISNGGITPSKIFGVKVVGNLLPTKIKFVEGKYAYESNGKLVEASSESYCYFIIPVNSQSLYSFSAGRFVLGLSDLETVIFYKENINSVNSESAKYLAISFNKVNTSIDNYAIVEGTQIINETYYELPWLYNKDKQFNNHINIPSKLYKLEDQSLNIYFDNIIDNISDYNIDIDCVSGIHYNDRVGSFNITSDTDISFYLYDKKQNIVNSVNSIIKHIPLSSGSGLTKKCLFIGDSTTDAGKYTKKLLDLFTSDNMNIELLGTRGSGLNKHEGRSGWSADLYCNTQQLTDKVNAFYNPTSKTFDFSYYMQQQNYNNVDYVFIHLGINDIFGYKSLDDLKNNYDNIINNFDIMINSIKKYSSNIKICIMLTIPPNANQTSFGSSYGCGQTRWIYKTNYHAWVDKLINTYDNRENENIYIVPINAFLDTTVDIADAVHPVKDTPNLGYEKMAMPIYYFIKYLGSL